MPAVEPATSSGLVAVPESFGLGCWRRVPPPTKLAPGAVRGDDGKADVGISNRRPVGVKHVDGERERELFAHLG